MARIDEESWLSSGLAADEKKIQCESYTKLSYTLS